MKYITYTFGVLSLIYSGFSIYKGSNVSDALICLGLAGVFGLDKYLKNKSFVMEKIQEKEPNEIQDLKIELEKEAMKERLEEFKYQSSQRKIRRDIEKSIGTQGRIQF